MHFQLPPFDQSKLAYIVSGKVLDVIVDLRKNSPTFGDYLSVELSEYNNKSVYIPKGLAHGFGVISKSSTVIHLTTSEYSQKHDQGIRWDSFGMKWPIEKPIVSDRDRDFKKLSEFDSPFVYGEKPK